MHRVQFLIQIIVFLLVFMMFLSTYLFQVGLLENLQREFRPILITLPAYFLVFIAYFAVKLVREMQGHKARHPNKFVQVLILDDKPWDRLWEEGLFVAVSLIHKVAAIFYWSVIIASTLKFGELRWYLRSAWVRHYQQSQADPSAGIANVV